MGRSISRWLDPATGTFETFGPFYYPGVTPAKTFNAYGLLTDSANSLWGLDFGATSIGHLDPTTGKFKIMATPTANSHPRRGRIDERTDILWFAEFGANRIGSYDTKADNGTITEYLMPTPSDNPYDAVPDWVNNATTPIQLWVGANHEGAIIKVEALP